MRKKVLIIMLALLLTVVLIGCNQDTAKNNSTKSLDYSSKVANIKIGNQKIDTKEFSGRLETIKGFWDEVGIDITAKDQGEFFDKVVEGLKEKMIHEAQVRQYAEENNIKIDKSEIIKRLEESEENKKYKDDITVINQIEIELIKDRIFESIFSKIEIEDKEIEDFYKENPQYFETDEMVKAKMILAFSKERAEEALNKLKEGAKFEDVVEKYSEDQGTAGEGGDLGTFEINSMFPDSEEFQTKVRKAKAGEYTDIITTEMGSYNIYKIVLVEEHISGSTIPLEDVKEDIKWFLSEEKSLLEFDKIMQKISSIKVEE